jgi:hypothetical protein
MKSEKLLLVMLALLLVSSGAQAQFGKRLGKAVEMAYAKSDFVAGDEIIFDDDLTSEQLGEFPSQWDLTGGTCEVVSVNGKKAFELFKAANKF